MQIKFCIKKDLRNKPIKRALLTKKINYNFTSLNSDGQSITFPQMGGPTQNMKEEYLLSTEFSEIFITCPIL